MKNGKLTLALALGISMFSSTLFASESVRELYNKNGIILNLTGDEKGSFKVTVENKSKKDMLNVKLVSEEIKGFKLVEGKELLLGDIKAGEKKVLDEKELKYEIEKEIVEAIKKEKLVKTGIEGVYKLYIPITIAGMAGCVYLLVSKRKNKKKMLSLAVSASILASAIVSGNVNAKEKYDHIENITGKLSINNTEYDYNGVLMWNDEKENVIKVEKETKSENEIEAEKPIEPEKPVVPNKDETEMELEKIKSTVREEISKLENISDKDKKDFAEKLNNAKTKEEILKILEEANKKNETLNKDQDKVVLFEDEKLKEVILNLFKNNTGYDGFGDTIAGEYEFKLSDPNYKLPQNATEIHESDMEKIEALALRGFTVDENFDTFPYEFKSLKGLETAKNLKQLTVSSGNIPQETDEDFINGIEYSKGSFSDLTPLAKLKKLEILRLSHNNIEDISPLKDLTHLKELYISHNKIKNISELKKLTALESFDFSKNEVSNMDVVKNFKNLKMLDLVRNKISDISSVKELVDINYLDITNNGVENIVALEGLNELQTLKAEKNKISNIDVLKDKTKLEVIYLSNNKLNDESLKNIDFSKFSNLKELTLASNGLTDISFVENLTNLNSLDVKNNKIENLPDLSKLVKLDSLDVKNNGIKDFSSLIEKKLSRMQFDNQNVDLKNEQTLEVEVKENKFEIPSVYKGLKDFKVNSFSTDKIDVKVSSDNENVTIKFEEDKLVFDVNEKAGEELKNGELSLNLTYSFEYEFSQTTLKVQNLKLKMSKEYVDIEDAGLLKVINKNLGQDRADNQKVTKEEMKSLKELSMFLNDDGTPHFSETGETTGTEKGILDAKSLADTPDFKFMVSRGIKSIKGLEYAINLEKLKLNENEISDITPLAKLTKLKYLEIQRNRIVDLKPLSGLVNLQYLKLYNNLIEDVTPLKTLVNLTDLDLHNNVTITNKETQEKTKGITDVSAVINNMPKLKFLDISANRIKSIKGLEKLDNIKVIDFTGNNISDYSGLSDYIFDRLLKMYDDENPEGSIGFSAQVVSFDKKLEVVDKYVEFENPFKGIKELSSKFAQAYGTDGYTLFSSISTSTNGVAAQHNIDSDKIRLEFSDEFIKNNNGKEVGLKLNLSDGEAFSWTLKDINLKFNVEDKDIVSEEYKDFYFDLFNKYSKMYKKYSNLTDNANKNFTESNKPKKDKVFTKDDMKMLKSITVTDKNVTDDMLKPLKYATNLEEIKIELNNKDLKRTVTNFSFLKDNPNLKIFYYLNQDPDFKEKENLPNIDFSNNKNLKDVRITKTNLSDIDFLKGLDLETLSIQDNEITDISPLKEMTNLIRLDLDNNKIVDLGNNLDKLQKLITLYLRDNPITDISALGNLKNLEALHLRNTNITDVSTLKNLPKLHRLYIDKMKNIQSDYFSIVKDLNGINTVFVDEIKPEDFNWLKTFSTRDAVDATYGEDKVRIFHFEKLEVPLEIKRTDIKDGKVSINNPLKDYDGLSVEENSDPENKNRNLTFNEDKIEISNIKTESAFEESYDIYIGDYSSGKGYGDYSQPAEISGKVILKIKVVD